mmetsp:Transcript_13212/g.38072  ORF Transcript_13212/g.38072 Transcript_13212/m.38072 type:complete len:436 (+) Transcript_13212:622-1929(+)
MHRAGDHRDDRHRRRGIPPHKVRRLLHPCLCSAEVHRAPCARLPQARRVQRENGRPSLQPHGANLEHVVARRVLEKPGSASLGQFTCRLVLHEGVQRLPHHRRLGGQARGAVQTRRVVRAHRQLDVRVGSSRGLGPHGRRRFACLLRRHELQGLRALPRGQFFPDLPARALLARRDAHPAEVAGVRASLGRARPEHVRRRPSQPLDARHQVVPGKEDVQDHRGHHLGLHAELEVLPGLRRHHPPRLRGTSGAAGQGRGMVRCAEKEVVRSQPRHRVALRGHPGPARRQGACVGVRLDLCPDRLGLLPEGHEVCGGEAHPGKWQHPGRLRRHSGRLHGVELQGRRGDEARPLRGNQQRRGVLRRGHGPRDGLRALDPHGRARPLLLVLRLVGRFRLGGGEGRRLGGCAPVPLQAGHRLGEGLQGGRLLSAELEARQ